MKSLTQPEAEAIALKALSFLGGETERLENFFAHSGLDVASLRSAAADPAFLGGVLDFLASDDRLLLAFAAESGAAPEAVQHARAVLCGPASFD